MTSDRCPITGREFDDDRMDKGRLSGSPGSRPYKQNGLWTRQARRYLLLSLACQPNPDRDRAQQLLAKMDARR